MSDRCEDRRRIVPRVVCHTREPDVVVNCHYLLSDCAVCHTFTFLFEATLIILVMCSFMICICCDYEHVQDM